MTPTIDRPARTLPERNVLVIDDCGSIRRASEIVFRFGIGTPLPEMRGPGEGKRHAQRAAKPREIDPSLSRQQRRLFERKGKGR